MLESDVYRDEDVVWAIDYLVAPFDRVVLAATLGYLEVSIAGARLRSLVREQWPRSTTGCWRFAASAFLASSPQKRGANDSSGGRSAK